MAKPVIAEIVCPDCKRVKDYDVDAPRLLDGYYAVVVKCGNCGLSATVRLPVGAEVDTSICPKCGTDNLTTKGASAITPQDYSIGPVTWSVSSA